MSLGIQTSGLMAGGYGGPSPGPTGLASNELWDGTSWTEVNDLNTSRYGGAAAGIINTAGLVFSGFGPNPTAAIAITESWDGTNWTEVNDMNSAEYQFVGFGSQTVALASYSTPPGASGMETWNGTSWSPGTGSNNGYARNNGSGTATAGS